MIAMLRSSARLDNVPGVWGGNIYYIHIKLLMFLQYNDNLQQFSYLPLTIKTYNSTIYANHNDDE